MRMSDDLAGLAERDQAATHDPRLSELQAAARTLGSRLGWELTPGGTGNQAERHQDATTDPGEGADTSAGAETVSGGHGWDRDWLLTQIPHRLPSATFSQPDLARRARRQIEALLAERDALNEALGNEADISLKLEQERDAAIADRDAHRAVRRAVAAMMRQAAADRDAARAEADQYRRELTDLRNGTATDTITRALACDHVYLSGEVRIRLDREGK